MASGPATTLELSFNADQEYESATAGLGIPSNPSLSPRSTILVADDNPDLLKLYLESLSRAGFNISTASDGREAVTSFIATRPEVVVLDYRMAGGDGLEAAVEILAMKPSSKIIMLTEEDLVPEEVERIGVEIFLAKPVSLQRLLNAVLALCGIKEACAIIPR